MLYYHNNSGTTKRIADSLNNLYDVKAYSEWLDKLDGIEEKFKANNHILETDKQILDQMVSALDKELIFCDNNGSSYFLANFRIKSLVDKSKKIQTLVSANVKPDNQTRKKGWIFLRCC